MAYRQLVRRVWALSVRDLRCFPVSTSAFISPRGSPSATWQPARSPSLTLSRSLSLTPARHVSFNVQDADDFTERVINSDLPVLVDFHAHWCGPCKILGPRLEKAVAKQQGRVTVAKVDIDEHTDLAIEYKVSAVPTVIAMRDGHVIDRFVGVIEEDQIDSFIGKLTG
ncbi:thioredoxin, mitochondrial-like [Conger conger]|nr:thioredoxin, mitochondrial-like [Conger conger]XP_061087796.1 thioredoxin, mitochondrial-like [Conger conger]XP_061087797.1 thioredoxin, mitochondrial-like [Conger conger]XP_061087798.1 thioredoxin, mitochondrial-like [Conger conger]